MISTTSLVQESTSTISEQDIIAISLTGRIRSADVLVRVSLPRDASPHLPTRGPCLRNRATLGRFFQAPVATSGSETRVLLVGLVFALAALRAAIVLSVGALGRGVFQTRLT